MGGLACAIPHFAILPGNGIPSDPAKLNDFDERLRRCFTQTDIVHGIEDAGKADAACALLKRSEWTMTDRATLKDMLDSLYGE